MALNFVAGVERGENNQKFILAIIPAAGLNFSGIGIANVPPNVNGPTLRV